MFVSVVLLSISFKTRLKEGEIEMSLEHLGTNGDISFYRGVNGETYQFINLETDQLVIPSTLGLTEENRYVLIE